MENQYGGPNTGPGNAGTSGSMSGGTDSSVTQEARDTASRTADQAKGAISSIADKAMEQVKNQLSTQKDRAAEEVSSVTQALHDTGKQLHDKGQAGVGDVVESAAGQVERLADYLNNHNIEDLFNELEGMARRNPAVFVGGAFVLGLAVARFLKSSRPEGGHGGQGGQWQSQRSYQGSYQPSYQGMDQSAGSTGRVAPASLSTPSGAVGAASGTGSEGIGTSSMDTDFMAGMDTGTAASASGAMGTDRSEFSEVDPDSMEEEDMTVGTSRDDFAAG